MEKQFGGTIKLVNKQSTLQIMAKRINEDDLQKMGLQRNIDGSYSKKKSVPQPREKVMGKNISQILDEQKTKTYPAYKDFDAIRFSQIDSQIANREIQFRSLKLTLFGEPMAKQSVRQGKNKAGKTIFYQKQVKVDKVKDYQKQIREQLPKDFVRFETCVFIRKLHFMFSPLKSFHHTKGKMDDIRAGKKFYKNSRPDMDNLQKLVLDSMSELVFSDDGIIVGFEDMKKYYGVGGCVIIELHGY